MKTTLQIALLTAIIFYVIFNCINFNDGYSEESINQFNEDRRFTLLIVSIISVILYFCVAFSNLF